MLAPAAAPPWKADPVARARADSRAAPRATTPAPASRRVAAYSQPAHQLVQNPVVATFVVPAAAAARVVALNPNSLIPNAGVGEAEPAFQYGYEEEGARPPMLREISNTAKSSRLPIPSTNPLRRLPKGRVFEPPRARYT